jgi:flagellar motor protein MotB
MRSDRIRNMNFKRIATLVAVATLAVGVLPGCRSTRTGDRSKVLEAENINLRQQYGTMEEQMRQAHAAQDDASARVQELRGEVASLEQEVRAAGEYRAQAAAATERLRSTQDELSRTELALVERTKRYEQLLIASRRAPAARPVAERPSTPLRPAGMSPETEAMRRDLQNQLASYGIRDLKVEVRRDRGGEERVALVLPDAFPSGKATLAYNASAVKAVISVGKMIKENYPNSSVVVEGHTDSDPIRKTNWGTNERLSEARAQAVETLLTNSGVPTGDVRVEGLGARQPLAMGNTSRAKSRNRRVEIFISPGR